MRNVITILKNILKKKPASLNKVPQIIPREKHSITRKHISKSALKVLYRLHNSGFSAFLVGGSVRDLLLGFEPKDFDVVTDARPEQVKKLFKNSLIIGRRFRLVHVLFGREVIEVATFRGAAHNEQERVKTQHGVLLRDNVYGALEDDVWRRDFTINALYYNIADFSVVDYTGGVADLEKRCLRVIGDAVERYTEDPARMLRAIRLAGKLDFAIEPSTGEPIKELKGLLQYIAPARIFDKMLKIFHSGKSFATFKLMQEYHILEVLFPKVVASLDDPTCMSFLEEALKNTDTRVAENKSINSAFLFAAILWCHLQLLKRNFESQNMSPHQALNRAISEVLTNLKTILIPKKFIRVIREIWHLQYHLVNIRPKLIYKVFYHPRFRAAYDFLLLATVQDMHLQHVANWWTLFQESDEQGRAKLIAEIDRAKHKRKKKRKI